MEDSAVLTGLAEQYRATLAMLRQAIEKCPEDLWLSEAYENRFWRLAYHTVFYTHFYLHASDKDFHPWPKHQADVNFLNSRPDKPGEPLPHAEPYTRDEVVEYCNLCRDEIMQRLAADKLDAPSGFFWLPFNRFSVHLYNLRHLAHHTGQLADRVRAHAGIGVSWVRSA